VLDSVKQESDKRAELKAMGIEKINPMPGVTLDQVYDEIGKNKGLVKERMAAQKEIDTARTKAKQREWFRKAAKRTPERAKIRKEMQAKEAAEKRAIKF
jgi:multidrug resistance efflux pump